MAVAYLGIGTNLDNRSANISSALREIANVADVDAKSRIYETAPIGFADQPAFWNLVIRVSTELSPHDLMRRLKRIESDMGRVTTFTNGPRLIDIDILTYDDIVLDDDRIQVPHPRMMERAFVLRPLAEIAPTMIDARSGRSISDALADVAEQVAFPVTA